jgi:heat shock protein HspQ
MTQDRPTHEAKFRVGQVVRHRMFDYRGVVYDADPEFGLTGEWYEQMARSRPPKDEPWYHVLVDGAVHTTYVSERNLEGDETGDPILHPALDVHFSGRSGGLYVRRARAN